MRRRNLVVVGSVLLFGMLAVHASPAARAGDEPPAPPPRSRFFFSGDGRLRMTHAHWKTQLDVRYRAADGAYDYRALAELRRFFRSRGDDVEGDISLRLVELIDFIEDQQGEPRLTLFSGFRSPELNASLPGTARASLHTQGLAADIGFADRDLRRLWRKLRDLRVGGVGYYPEGFLHLDTGQARFWEASTSRTSENLSGGNARAFARSEFDRYVSLEGARISLHSVTVFPLAVATEARVVGDDGEESRVELAPPKGSPSSDRCIVFADPLVEPQLVVSRAPSPEVVPLHQRGSIHLRTCKPRPERTPAEIVTNSIEWIR